MVQAGRRSRCITNEAAVANPGGKSHLRKTWVLQKGLHDRSLWNICKRSRGRKAGCAGLSRSPLPDSNRRPPPYHGTSQATGGSRWQRISPVSAAFAAPRFATACHRLQPRGSIKAPSSVVGFGRVGGRSASIFARRLVREPGSWRRADLPLVAEWVDDPAEPPAVLVAHPGRFPRAGGHRLPDDPLRVVD